jgi:hypothetical protein
MRKYPLLLGVLLLVWISVSVGEASAANWYVREGAIGSGSGTDWTDAYTSLPPTLNRGDIYYIGDGTYGGYTFDDSESGTTYITIKKATASDHGTSAGWDPSYGDGQAVFNERLTFSRGYYEFNGNHVPSSGLATEWGFKVAGSPGTANAILLNSNSGTLSYVKIINVHLDMSGDTSGENKCIKGRYGGTDNRYITVSYCKLENFGDAISIDGNGDYTYEYNYFHRTASDGSGDHGDAIVFAVASDTMKTSNCVIRYNVFSWNGQNIFFSGYATWSFDNYTIYGNLFYSEEAPSASCSSIFQNSAGPAITNLKAYNNDFYHVYYSIHPRVDTTMYGDFRNNIVYLVNTDNAFRDVITHDYNYYQTGTSVSEAHMQTGGDPFVSASDYSDFSLSGATEPGEDLGPPYNIDAYGNVRGADGVWDMGAYEYVSGASYECSDGLDNDGDGQTDLSDAGCSSPSDNDETNCGDGECEGGETCSSCSQDCPTPGGQVCCSGTLYTGDCCSSSECTGSDTCQDHVCQAPAPTCTGQGYQCCTQCESGTAQPSFDADCSPQLCCGDCYAPPAQYFLPNQTIEAEAGLLTSPMQTGSSASASNGTYVYASEDDQGSCTFSFDIQQPGRYYLQARINPNNSSARDSFFVGLDNEPAQGNESYTFDTVVVDTFTWDNVSLRGPNGTFEYAEFDPMVWELSAGIHNITFYCREANAWLDQVILREFKNYHPADTSKNCAIELGELVSYIGLWYQDSSTNPMSSLMGAIGHYSRGTNSCT